MGFEQNLARIAIAELSIGIVFLLVILLQFFITLRRHRATKSLVLSMGMIITGMILALTMSIIGELSWFGLISDKRSTSFFMAGFAMYFAGWLLGLSTFTTHIVRLPEDRKARFQNFNRILSLLVIITIIGIYITLSFPSTTFKSIRLVTLSFIIIASFATLGFFFYYKVLGTEIEKNASKLIKARLQLIRYAIQTQLILLLGAILGNSVIILGFSKAIAQTFVFAVASILFVSSGVVFRWVIYIPHRIRIRFNLTATRFKYIQQIIAKH